MRPSDEQGVLPLAEGSIFSAGTSFFIGREELEWQEYPRDRLVIAAVAAEELERRAVGHHVFAEEDDGDLYHMKDCPACKNEKSAFRWRRWGRAHA